MGGVYILDEVGKTYYKIFKKTPFAWITGGLERKLGKLDNIDKGIVSAGYALSTLIYTTAGINFYSGLKNVAAFSAFASSCFLAATVLHQYVSGKRESNNINIEL